jgi:Zn finger protein HypA/HybF involved in hydrogenase expression
MQMIPRLSAIVDHLLQQTARIESVNIALGDLTVFREDEIRSQWARLTGNTELSQTQLVIHHIAAEQQCMVCFEKYHPINKETSCPHCGSVGAKILAGEEFFLESMKEENE